MLEEKVNIGARRSARRLAMQAIYQWQLTGHSAEEVVDQFRDSEHYDRVDKRWFAKLVRYVINSHQQLDARLAPHMDRPVEQVDPIELAILRLSVGQLVLFEDLPWRVVINESLELAKKFAGDDAHKYINAVLDKLIENKD